VTWEESIDEVGGEEKKRSARGGGECALVPSLFTPSPLSVFFFYLDGCVAVRQIGRDAGDVGNVVQGELMRGE